MALYYYTYANLTERQQKIAVAEGLGYRMLNDNFDDPNWKHGDPMVGTLTFTDEAEPPPPEPEPPPPEPEWSGQVTYEQQTGVWANPQAAPVKGRLVVVENTTQGTTRMFRCSDGVNWEGVKPMEGII